MAEENAVQEDENVELVYEGVIPKGESTETCLEVEAKATISENEFKAAKGFYPFGANLADAVKRYGEEEVFTNFRAQAKIKLQAATRSYIKRGLDLDKLLQTWKPGVQLERAPVDPLVAAENAFDKMSEEERAAFIEKLMAKQG